MQLVMLKCVGVLDVFQAHELIYVWVMALPIYSRQNSMRVVDGFL
jgi:hypothetical protein